MLHDISHDTPAGSGSDGADSGDQLARQEAIKQIERKRRYWISTGLGALGMILLAVIWAIAEYHNAGGLPTQGFSQSSGIPNVWNYWIIYPAIAWLFLTWPVAWPFTCTSRFRRTRSTARSNAKPAPGIDH